MTEGKTVMLSTKEEATMRDRRIMTWAKSIALVLIVSGLIATLTISALKSGITLELLNGILPVLSGILAFIGGRSGR